MFAPGTGVAVGEPVGVAVGVAVAVDVGEAVGVGVGEVNALPSNEPGLVALGEPGVDVVAFELKASQRPSLLITGRVLTISTLMLLKVAGAVASKSTLLVSVI